MRFLITIAFLFFASQMQAQKVVALTLDGTINPASAGFIEKAIRKAEKEEASCVLLRLNTPGGLLKSTRNIVGTIFSSTGTGDCVCVARRCTGRIGRCVYYHGRALCSYGSGNQYWRGAPGIAGRTK
jgi:hypothetical protein